MFAPTTAADHDAALTPRPDEWIELHEAARLLGNVCERTVQRYTKPLPGQPDAPVLLCARPSRGVWLFRRSWIDAFLEATARHQRDLDHAATPPRPRPAARPIDPMVARISDTSSRRRRSRPNGRRSDPAFLPIPRSR